MKKRGKIRGLKGILWLGVFLALAGGPLGADSRRHVTVSVGLGGFFGVPVYGFGGFYYPAQYPPGVYIPPPTRPYYAFVDTDIHPEEAEVYLDGRLIGTADDFDGYPGYLAFKPGRHNLFFHHPRYRSLSFDLDLRAGEMVHLDQKMPRLEPGQKPEPPPAARPRENAGEPPAPAPENSPEMKSGPREAHGTLVLSISPPEARVVLDGDFFGTGGEISRLHAGIPLAPGTHRVRVSLEGYKSVAMETEILPAQERVLQISLKKQ